MCACGRSLSLLITPASVHLSVCLCPSTTQLALNFCSRISTTDVLISSRLIRKPLIDIWHQRSLIDQKMSRAVRGTSCPCRAHSKSQKATSPCTLTSGYKCQEYVTVNGFSLADSNQGQLLGWYSVCHNKLSNKNTVPVAVQLGLFQQTPARSFLGIKSKTCVRHLVAGRPEVNESRMRGPLSSSGSEFD